MPNKSSVLPPPTSPTPPPLVFSPSPHFVIEGDLAKIGYGHVAPVEGGEDDRHGEGVATRGDRPVVCAVRVQQAVAPMVILQTRSDAMDIMREKRSGREANKKNKTQDSKYVMKHTG